MSIDNKQFKIPNLIGIIVILFLMSISCFIGYSEGIKKGVSDGYLRGQVDLSLLFLKEGVGTFVDKTTIDNSYSHFIDIKDITIYIRDVNGTKTLAFWRAGQ